MQIKRFLEHNELAAVRQTEVKQPFFPIVRWFDWCFYHVNIKSLSENIQRL